MPEAVVIQLAEAVKDSLDAATFDEEFTPTRGVLPAFDIDALGTLTVVVVPKSDEASRVARHEFQHVCEIDVAVMHKVDPQDTAAVDAKVKLAQDIADHLRDAGRLAGAAFLHAVRDPIWRPDHIQKGVFTGVITATYRVQRSQS